jgi:WD40 repeat protein
VWLCIGALGHQNDRYSQPKIAWFSNGHYLFGNTQHENNPCVWDVASSFIAKRLGGHTGVIRDMFSSSGSDTLVTVSYDKSAKVWLNSM